MTTRSKNVLFAAVSMIGSVLLTLLVAEIAIRYWEGWYDLEADPYVIRSLAPNERFEVRRLERGGESERTTTMPKESIHVGWSSTNNLGFRMIDDVVDKAPGEQRVLLLGDSYLEARQVDAPDRFAEIVSRKLAAETQGRWKVINLGIPSGSPLQYLMQLHHWADRLEPDLVIVFLGANDAPDDIRARQRYGVVTDDNGVPIRPAKRFSLALLRVSHLARHFAKYALTQRPNFFALISPPQEEPGTSKQSKSRGEVDAWIELACEASEPARQAFLDGSGQYLRMLRDVSEKMGAGFAVVLVHYPFYFPNEPFFRQRWSAAFLQALEDHDCAASQGKAFEDFVRGFLRESQIEFASTYDPFIEAKRRNPEQKLWYFYDYHYNEAGNELVAEELHRLIERMIAERPGA